MPAPWELRMLLHALDAVLATGDDALVWRLRFRLTDLKRTIWQDYPDLAPDYIRRANDSPAVSPGAVDESRPARPSPATLFLPKAVRRAIRSMKSDGLRAIVDAAIEQGWRASLDGGGHIRLTNPDGRRIFAVSATAYDGNVVAQVRSQARREGLKL